MYCLFKRMAINKECFRPPWHIICILSYALHRQALMNRMNKRLLVLSSTWNNHLTVLISLHSNFILWGQHQVFIHQYCEAKTCIGGGMRLSLGKWILWLTRNSFLLLGYPSRIALIMSEAWERQKRFRMSWHHLMFFYDSNGWIFNITCHFCIILKMGQCRSYNCKSVCVDLYI